MLGFGLELELDMVVVLVFDAGLGSSPGVLPLSLWLMRGEDVGCPGWVLVTTVR